jgi:hypothetical protein
MSAVMQPEMESSLRLVEPLPPSVDQTVQLLANHLANAPSKVRGACVLYHIQRDDVVALYPVEKEGYDLGNVVIGIVTAARSRLDQLEEHGPIRRKSTLCMDEILLTNPRVFGGGDDQIMIGNYAFTDNELLLDGEKTYVIQILARAKEVEGERHIIGKMAPITYTCKEVI